MKSLWLVGLAALGLSACASKLDGPTPVVTSVTPNIICTAQSDQTITIQGTGFSPAVIKGLNDDPEVAMPRVLLVDASSAETEVPPANVSLPPGDASGTTLIVVIPMGLVGPNAAGDAEAVYDLRVINPNTNEGSLQGALTIVPPPSLTGIDPATGPQGQVVAVTLTGTGFRDGMTVTLDATPAVPGSNVTVVSPTEATTSFDLTGVAAGVYDVTVQNPDGCSFTLPGAFTVYVAVEFQLTGIDPPFGCTCADTTVTITSAAGFVSTPRVEMRLSNGMGDPVEFSRVAFIDANTLTAVVPAGAALGLYDVTVFNPPSDGGIGSLPEGFRVVSMPILSIEAVVPSRGEPATNTAVTIYGENFRDPVKVELIDDQGVVATTVASVTPVSANQIDTTLLLGDDSVGEGIYLVRVTNLDEDTYATYSAFIVAATGPSGNLHPFVSESTLNTGRRMLAGVSARDDDGNRFVYAIGGDAGGAMLTGNDVHATVEVAQLSKFGQLSAWRELAPVLASGRSGAAAVAVPVFDPMGSAFVPTRTYVYVLGGLDDADTVLGSIERAVVLSADDAPVITAAGANAAPGTLAAGTWYYKVTAVLAATDPDNPAGETLASEEAIVTLAADGSIELAWNTVNVNGANAVEYRVYRTDAANGASQNEHLIATTMGTSFVDSGESAGTEPPPPPGALGTWVASGSLGTARWGHGAALVSDASGNRYVAVVGGKSNPANGYLGTVEYFAVNDATGGIGGFSTTNAASLNVARAFFGFAIETSQNVAGLVGGNRLFVLGGIGAGGALSANMSPPESSNFLDGGGNDNWATYPIPGYGNPGTRAGTMMAIGSEKLFTVGGATMASDSSIGNILSSAVDIPFAANGALDQSSTFSSAAESLQASRALGTVVAGSGFFYFIGGTSNGTNALSTAESTF